MAVGVCAVLLFDLSSALALGHAIRGFRCLQSVGSELLNCRMTPVHMFEVMHSPSLVMERLVDKIRTSKRTSE